MHHNGRPSIAVSTLTPNRYSLDETVKTVVCPDCGTHRRLRRSMVIPHDRADAGARCPGSGQRFTFDITAEQWSLLLRHASHATELRRSNRVMLKPEPPVAAPVFRLAADRRRP